MQRKSKAVKRQQNPGVVAPGAPGWDRVVAALTPVKRRLGPASPPTSMQGTPRFQGAADVTIEDLQRAGIVSSPPAAARTKPAGSSSPALRIACPVCKSPPGAYCTKIAKALSRLTGDIHRGIQIIAHKKRRELAMVRGHYNEQGA